MKHMTSWLVALCLIATTAGAADEKKGELSDPLEILKKVDAAAKAVKAVKFDVVFQGIGASASQVGKITGTYKASGYSNGSVEKLRCDIEVEGPSFSKTGKFSGGGDGDMFFVVDHQSKMAYEDIDPAVVGSYGRILRPAMMIEFLHTAPFTDEINGSKQELTGSKTIGGEECYEIRVVYAAERAPEATWYFSKKDFLPRCRIDKFTLSNGEPGGRKRTITNLVVNPKFADDEFRLKLPEGYTKTDDFAP